MELKEQYKRDKHTFYIKGRRVVVENDESKFELYKRLKLDVFKPKKKVSDITNKSDNK